MADGLDDIVPQIRIEGGDEAAAALKNIGEVGAAAFAQIAEAASHGDFTGLATLVGGDLAGAFTKVTQTVLEMVHGIAEAVDTMQNLANASGATLSQFEGLQEAFASAGISATGFDRSMARLAQTISQSWVVIQEQARTGAAAEESAQLGMQSAALSTARAYENLQKTMSQVSDQAVHDSQSIVDARLNLEKAQNAQLKAGGADTSASDALIKQEEQANAVTKARQALYEANEKKAQDEAEAVNKIKEAQLAIEKARLAEADAAEKAHETELKDLDSISAALGRVKSQQSNWKDESILTENSAQRLAQALIKMSSGGSGIPPSSIEVLKTTAELFSKMDDSAESMNGKLEIMQRLMGAGFRAGQASAAQLVAVLSMGEEALEKFQNEAKAFSESGIGVNSQDAANLRAFADAWAELGAVVGQVEQHLAAVVSIGLTAFLQNLKSSLEDNDGVLHAVAQALALVAEGFSALLEWIVQVAKIFGPMFSAVIAVVKDLAAGVAELTAYWAKLAGIGPAAQLIGWATAGIIFATALSSVAQSIAKVFGETEGLVIVVGLAVKAFAELIQVYAVWTKNAETFNYGKNLEQGANQVLRSATGGVSDKAGLSNTTAGGQADPGAAGAAAANGLNQTATMADHAASTIEDMATQAQNAATALQSIVAAASNTQGHAAGGHISGPGGPADDRAGLFPLSNGEYVVQTAAVNRYGVDFFHALNNMSFGGFAGGGRVGPALPSSSVMPNHGASSILNLTIDGQHFNGLRAPENVAQKLKMHAVSRQSTAAGRNPSWLR